MAYFNFVLVRLDYLENSEKGRQVGNGDERKQVGNSEKGKQVGYEVIFALLVVLTCHCTSMVQAIGSLAELMKLMGRKYITNVKMKIIAVLR